MCFRINILQFAGPPNTICDDEFIQEIIRNTSLEAMQQNQDRWLYPDRAWTGSNHGFVREGAVSGWRKTLSYDQSVAISQKYNEKLEGTVAENWFLNEMI